MRGRSLIAPTPEGYPTPIEHSVNLSDPTDPLGNDNYLFNVSHTIGDHVMCTQLRGATAVGFTVLLTADDNVAVKCPPFLNEPNTAGPGGSRPLG